MTRARPRRRWPWMLLGLVVLAVNVAGLAVLGPHRAARLAYAGAAHTLVDGIAASPAHHRIEMVDLTVDPKDLASLESDLPWSGGSYKPVMLRANGVEFAAQYRLRGAGMPSHFVAEKRSFRLKLPKRSPFSPYRTLNFLNPKSMNMLNAHVAFWIAGRMGVAVPYDDLAFVRINGHDRGVMEMVEQPDGRYEEVRHLAEHQVAVFKGDLPPIRKGEVVAPKRLWADAKAWQYAGKADSTAAMAALAAVIDALRSPDSTMMPRLDTLIDVEAFARYCAAIKLINTQHIDNVHNQWLVAGSRTHRFYPVLWDPVMFGASGHEPFYPIHDALAFALLRNGAFRLERDRCLYRGWKKMHLDSLVDAHIAEVVDRIRPSVMADREKAAILADGMDDVVRYSNLEWARSVDYLAGDLHAYWSALADHFRIADLHLSAANGEQRITWSGGMAVRITWTGASIPVFDPHGTSEVRIDPSRHEVELMPVVKHCDGDKADPFAGGRWYDPLPVEVRITWTGGNADQLRYFNAVTDEEITPK